MNRTYRQVLDSAAATHIADDLDLFPRVKARLSQRRTLMQTVRARPALVIALVILALLLLTGAAYAIGRLTGYIPGVGLIDRSAPWRVLAEPVSMTRDGLVVGIDKVVADSVRTMVNYHIHNLPFNPNGFPVCGRPPYLRLEGGAELDLIGGGAGGGEMGSFAASAIYPPLPANTKEAALVFPCILPEDKAGPANWEIAFSLVAAPDNLATPGVEVAVTYAASGPVFEATASPTSAATAEYATSFPSTPTAVPHGSGLYLDKVIELENAYLLIGNFTNAGDLPGPLMIGSDSDFNDPLIVTDANGDPVPARARSDIKPSIQWSQTYYWAYEIPKPVTAPLTLRLQSVDIERTESAYFQFDTGANPPIGQTWNINRPITLLGSAYVIEGATMTQTGYVFIITYPSRPDSSGGLADLRIRSANAGEAAARTWFEYPTSERAIVDYASGHPATGSLTVELTAIKHVPLTGPWILTWSPPPKP